MPACEQVLEELLLVIEAGYAEHTLQRSPHLTLLNEEWYVREMKPVMAKWMQLWLEANHVSGLQSEHLVSYITRDCSALLDAEWDAAVEEEAEGEALLAASGAPSRAGPDARAVHSRGSAEYANVRLDALVRVKLASGELTAKAMQLVNLAEEWLSTFLPHCLQKIDRVSFGLLSMEEMRKAQKLDPHMPRSRLKLAIPFLGKDVPSAASEFAHPDIIIGLTVLAYRYEGLRKVDFEQDLIALLRSNFENESGPYRLRPSSLMYNTWVEQAGGRTKGAEPKPKTAAAAVLAPAKPSGGGERHSAAEGEGEEAAPEDEPVVPLWLLKQSNEEQVGRLFQLLRRLPQAIHWYLEQTIFPTYTQHQRIKLSASGQELGGAMLFPSRIGFSGTPSDLLPLDLGYDLSQRLPLPPLDQVLRHSLAPPLPVPVQAVRLRGGVGRPDAARAHGSRRGERRLRRLRLDRRLAAAARRHRRASLPCPDRHGRADHRPREPRRRQAAPRIGARAARHRGRRLPRRQ